MSAAEQAVHRYIDSFNETDPGRRRDLIADLYTEDCGYTDPNVELTGQDEIEQFMRGTQQQFPGVKFSLGSEIDAHHNQARFTWHASSPDAMEPIAIGSDVIVTEADRIRQVYGFIDKAPTN